MQDIGAQTDPSSAFGTPGSAVVSSQSVTSMPVQTGPPARPQLNVAYNPKTKELNISSLGYQLRCPNGLKITWLPQSAGGTTTQVLFSKEQREIHFAPTLFFLLSKASILTGYYAQLERC